MSRDLMVGWLVGSRLLQRECQTIINPMTHIYKDMQEQFCVVMPNHFAGMCRFSAKIKPFVLQINTDRRLFTQGGHTQIQTSE